MQLLHFYLCKYNNYILINRSADKAAHNFYFIWVGWVGFSPYGQLSSSLIYQRYVNDIALFWNTF